MYAYTPIHIRGHTYGRRRRGCWCSIFFWTPLCPISSSRKSIFFDTTTVFKGKAGGGGGVLLLRVMYLYSMTVRYSIALYLRVQMFTQWYDRGMRESGLWTVRYLAIHPVWVKGSLPISKGVFTDIDYRSVIFDCVASAFPWMAFISFELEHSWAASAACQIGKGKTI